MDQGLNPILDFCEHDNEPCQQTHGNVLTSYPIKALHQESADRRKWLWSDLKYYSDIYLEGLRKYHASLSQDNHSLCCDISHEYEAGVLNILDVYMDLVWIFLSSTTSHSEKGLTAALKDINTRKLFTYVALLITTYILQTSSLLLKVHLHWPAMLTHPVLLSEV